MHSLQLVIPDFTRPARSDVTPPRLPALEWLLARGRREALAPSGWRQALLESAGFQCDGPLPLAATIADRPGHWALATPVCLLAGLETVHLHPAGLLRLDADEQHDLAESFGEGFGADGYRLEFRDGQGLLELPRAIQVDTHDPADVLGREASALLPQGTDAAWLRRLLTEMQMWLHDHAVNRRRESRGAPPCNALWIWGAATGRLLPPPRASLPAARERRRLPASRVALCWGGAAAAAGALQRGARPGGGGTGRVIAPRRARS